MKPNEATQLMSTMITYFGKLPREPEWGEPLTVAAWRDMLADFEMVDALAAVNDLREQLAVKPDRERFFPFLDEFARRVRQVATDSEREVYARDALTAAIRCDGSRWIDNAPDALGHRPFPSKGDGLVACPTCSPSMHKRQLGGNQHEPTPRGEQASLPPCHREHEGFDGPTIAGRGEIARAKAMLVPADSRAPAPRVFRSIRELDEPEADTTPQATDRALRCPWCGGSVTRTKLAQWWRCENGEMATMRQILAGSGGGR